MKYIGSKNRISKYLKPIIESYLTDTTDRYIEPFVGGANMIDKINFPRKHGIDNHPFLIALLRHVRDGGLLPDHCSEDHYNEVKRNPDQYPDWYIGCIGFCGSFGSKYMDTFARGYKNDKVTPRDIFNEGVRNLRKQSPHLHGIEFEHGSYEQLTPENTQNCLIYCDPPYRNTTKYSTSTDFDHDAFYDWVRKMSTCNTVLVSEYEMPDDFICIWERDLVCHVNNSALNGSSLRTERLFTIGAQR